MELILKLALLTVLSQPTLAILKLGNTIPTTWRANFRNGEYVKDNDDCNFGYRILPSTNQVIDIFNCTRSDPGVFFSIRTIACGTVVSLAPYTSENCLIVPTVSELDTTFVPNYRDCVNVSRDVAPDPQNCARFLQCDNNGNRYGSRQCGSGLYFDTTSYQCENMWRDQGDGRVVALNLDSMCGTRSLPVYLQRNIGAIMNKCLWKWGVSNSGTFSVAEPLNCRFRYLCSTFNPFSVENSDVKECTVDTYWSESRQACVTVAELTSFERSECNL